jgi:hypothetical protein
MKLRLSEPPFVLRLDYDVWVREPVYVRWLEDMRIF